MAKEEKLPDFSAEEAAMPYLPNYHARQIGAATVAGGVLGAAGRVATDLNPAPVTRMVTKSVIDPEGVGGSVARHVMETFTPHAPVLNDLIKNAGETGVKGMLLAGGAVAAYKGAKRLHAVLSYRQHNK